MVTVGSRIVNFLQANSSSGIIPSQYLSNLSTQNSLFFNVTTSLKAKIIIMSPNKFSHIYTYFIEIIKYFSNLIYPILPILINLSVCTGTFPQILKVTRVVPVFKSSNKEELNNYRPISILPILSKKIHDSHHRIISHVIPLLFVLHYQYIVHVILIQIIKLLQM